MVLNTCRGRASSKLDVLLQCGQGVQYIKTLFVIFEAGKSDGTCPTVCDEKKGTISSREYDKSTADPLIGAKCSIWQRHRERSQKQLQHKSLQKVYPLIDHQGLLRVEGALRNGRKNYRQNHLKFTVFVLWGGIQANVECPEQEV